MISKNAIKLASVCKDSGQRGEMSPAVRGKNPVYESVGDEKWVILERPPRKGEERRFFFFTFGRNWLSWKLSRTPWIPVIDAGLSCRQRSSDL